MITLERNPTDLSSVVDELAAVQAQIAELEAEEKLLKKTLADSCQRTILGSLHKATVSYVQESYTTDYRSVVMHLKVPDEVLSLFQKKKEGYSTVTLRGR